MGKGQAIAGLVLGIVGIVIGLFIAYIGLPLTIVGLVLSVIGGKKLKAAGQPSGIATAGLVLNIIGIVITGIFFACALCVLCAAGEIAAAGAGLYY